MELSFHFRELTRVGGVTSWTVRARNASSKVTHAQRTRAEILRVATELAARDGLEGLSIGALAEATQMSKAGVFVHFGSKEALQLAIVDAAFQSFLDEVAIPAMEKLPGRPRLEALFDGYFRYVTARADRGGCFFTSASLEFDDRPGAVRDKIVSLIAARDLAIETAIQEAKAKRQVRGVPRDLSRAVVALATGATVQFQLSRDESVFKIARQGMELLLGVSGATARTKRNASRA